MDLTSIAAASKTVPLGKGTVEITGLSLSKLAQSIVRYPELLSLAAGKIEPTILFSAPGLALAMFSLGIVERKKRFWQFWILDEVSILKAFEEAPLGQQLDLLKQIYDMTFAGESARPFLAAVRTSLQIPRESPAPEASRETSPTSSAS